MRGQPWTTRWLTLLAGLMGKVTEETGHAGLGGAKHAGENNAETGGLGGRKPFSIGTMSPFFDCAIVWKK